MKKSIFGAAVLAGSLSLASWGVPTLASNAIDTYEMAYTEIFPLIPCVGEAAELQVIASVRNHEFTTPNGVYHLVDFFEGINGIAVGLTTGRVWTAKGPSPWIQNVKTGEVLNSVANWEFTPVADGPKFRLHNMVKMTVNANGEVVVDSITYSDKLQAWDHCFKDAP
jgi:hypothetical protein